MSIPFETFRQALLQAVRNAKRTARHANVHLVYCPELHDPLQLVADETRVTAHMRSPGTQREAASVHAHAPRLVTLDCRRVAAYFLESDPALDDPLFEASITQSYAETCLGDAPAAEIDNSDPHLSGASVGGWIVTQESAHEFSRRLNNFANSGPNRRRTAIRWTDRTVMSSLWPTLTKEQCTSLLGDASWFVHDLQGKLHHYAADKFVQAEHSIPIATSLDAVQSQTLQNVALVRELLPKWQEISEQAGTQLPNDAERRLHAYVRAAQTYGLDAESVAIYAMTAVQLKDEATADPEWIKLMTHVAYNGLLLRDLMDKLSDDFWNRYYSSSSESNV